MGFGRGPYVPYNKLFIVTEDFLDFNASDYGVILF